LQTCGTNGSDVNTALRTVIIRNEERGRGMSEKDLEGESAVDVKRRTILSEKNRHCWVWSSVREKHVFFLH